MSAPAPAVMGKRANRGKARERAVLAGPPLQDITNGICNVHISEANSKTVEELTGVHLIAADNVIAVHNVIADKENMTIVHTDAVGKDCSASFADVGSLSSLPAVASSQQDQTFLQPQFRPPDCAVHSAGGAVTSNVFEEGNVEVQTDSRALNNMKYVSEYCDDIFAFDLRGERRGCVDSDYLSRQPHVNSLMRARLVDWVVEVNKVYDFKPETLFLSVNLLDRYMAVATVLACNLQLVGVAAMLIASKVVEVGLPEVSEFVQITDNSYTCGEICEMECTMLATIEYKITVPTVAHLFPHLEQANNCCDVQSQFVMYMLELALLDTRYLNHSPSYIVSAALLLSNELFGRFPIWPEAMVEKSQYEETVLQPCTQELLGLFPPNPMFPNVPRKYEHLNAITLWRPCSSTHLRHDVLQDASWDLHRLR